MLFLPLLPLGQNQKEWKVDETSFESNAYDLHKNHFEVGNWPAFALYLTSHVANPFYAKKSPHEVTWVLVMRMLRNIVAHEQSMQWAGVVDCLNQVLKYTKNRDNFRVLVRTYEMCLLP